MIVTKTAVILTAVGIGWNLTSSMSFIRTTWLGFTLLDTYKALRSSRPNGRKIGIVTRRKVMRDALICWIIYVVGQSFSPLHAMFSWIPFYNPLINLLSILFLMTRLTSSTVVYHSLIPYIKPYETPIDLTFLLLHSLSVLVVHYSIHLPLSTIRSSIEPLVNITSRINRYSSSSHHTTFEVETTVVDVDNLPDTPLPSVPRVARQSPSRSRGRRQPPDITQIIVISPPSSPAPVDALIEAGPSTPPRRRLSQESALQAPVSDTQPLRRSPRKIKADRNIHTYEGTAKFDIDSLLLQPAVNEGSRRTVAGPRPKSSNIPSRSVSIIDLTNDEKPKGETVGEIVAESKLSGKTKNRTTTTTRTRIRRAETSASLAQTDSTGEISKPIPRRARVIPHSKSQTIPLPSTTTATSRQQTTKTKALPRSSTQPRSRNTAPSNSSNASTNVPRPRGRAGTKNTVTPIAVEEKSEEDAKVGEKRRIVAIGGEAGRKRQRVKP